MIDYVKLVVQVKLLPTPVQAAALESTLRACNEAACWLSEQAYAASRRSRAALQGAYYQRLKQRGLSAQPVLHVIRKVADAYTTLGAIIRTGNLGEPGSKRRTRAEGRPIAFRPDAAQPFDNRCLSWQYDAGTVSIWTIGGRMKDVAFTGHPGQLKALRDYRRGESDLVYRDGMWFLLATLDVPETPLNPAPTGWLGVDLGIVNIATTSDGKIMAGRGLNRYRERKQELRAKLQAKNTKSAKRVLKRQKRKEARFATDTNHCIAKKIVAEAQRTGRGIALEELTGIRERVRLRKPQRAALHSWPFAQLDRFVCYRAVRDRVPVVHVDPAYTSRQCADCHHIEKRNRPSQAVFVCRGCGVVAHADRNAARNIRARGAALRGSGAQSIAPAPA